MKPADFNPFTKRNDLSREALNKIQDLQKVKINNERVRHKRQESGKKTLRQKLDDLNAAAKKK